MAYRYTKLSGVIEPLPNRVRTVLLQVGSIGLRLIDIGGVKRTRQPHRKAT